MARRENKSDNKGTDYEVGTTIKGASPTRKEAGPVLEPTQGVTELASGNSREDY